MQYRLACASTLVTHVTYQTEGGAAGLRQGAGTRELGAELRPHFQKVLWARPRATRRASREVYLLGLSRRS